MSSNVKALWFTGPGKATIQEEKLPALNSQNCMVETAFSCISTGTEQKVFSGNIPPELFETMRVPYMQGSFEFPVKYGYSITGRVIEGPAHLIGKGVHALHPHQSHCLISVDDLFLLPEELPLMRATLLSNLETVITAIWDSQITLGDVALIVGFGNIGSLLARVLKDYMGIEVVISEINDEKRQKARELGFNTVEPQTIEQPIDVAFNTGGNTASLQSAIESVGFEGRIVELSWYGVNSVQVNLGGSFHSQRKQIISTQVSNIPAHRRSRFDSHRRKQLACKILKRVDFDQHISREVAFQGLAQLFTQGIQEKELIICVRYR